MLSERSIRPRALTLRYPTCPQRKTTAEDAQLAMIRGWMMHAGPITGTQIANILGLAPERALLHLETSGVILRGKFTDPSATEIEWCERRLLARIHRLTLGQLRKQVESVTPAQFMNWLFPLATRCAEFSIARRTRSTGRAAPVCKAMNRRQIRGSAKFLARRIANYDPKDLDQLCLTGAVGWGRLSPHPATLELPTDGKRRVVPSKRCADHFLRAR